MSVVAFLVVMALVVLWLYRKDPPMSEAQRRFEERYANRKEGGE